MVETIPTVIIWVFLVYTGYRGLMKVCDGGIEVKCQPLLKPRAKSSAKTRCLGMPFINIAMLIRVLSR